MADSLCLLLQRFVIDLSDCSFAAGLELEILVLKSNLGGRAQRVKCVVDVIHVEVLLDLNRVLKGALSHQELNLSAQDKAGSFKFLFVLTALLVRFKLLKLGLLLSESVKSLLKDMVVLVSTLA